MSNWTVDWSSRAKAPKSLEYSGKVARMKKGNAWVEGFISKGVDPVEDEVDIVNLLDCPANDDWKFMVIPKLSWKKWGT